MKKFIDLSFNVQPGISDAAVAIAHYHEGLGYLHFLRKNFEITFVDHLNYEGGFIKDDINFQFFKGNNHFLHLPLAALSYIRKVKPDVVLVQGLKFPLQTILLRLFTGKECMVIAQHHAELPFKGIKTLIHKIADRCIDAYIFTAQGNAKEWIKKLGSDPAKYYEVLEGSTSFRRQDKDECRAKLGITNEDVFLWVARLAVGKDPITVLTGFEKYLNNNPAAILYMIYQAEDLLAQVKEFIQRSPSLKRAVVLKGKINHDELEYWFSAADFYLSGSIKEAAGFALIEAMACGCIPIVTDIPPFRKITNGNGFLFKIGNTDSLYQSLLKTLAIKKDEASTRVAAHFEKEMTFEAIANSIQEVVTAVNNKTRR